VNSPISGPPRRFAETPEDDDLQLSPEAIWIAIRKSIVLTTTIIVAVTLAVAFFTLGATRIYEATAVLMFGQPPRPLGDRVQTVIDTEGGYAVNKEYFKTQYWVLRSLRITSEVVRQLGLNRDATFLDNVPAGTSLPRREIPVEDAAIKLSDRINVDPVKESRLANVKVRDADPERARKIASVLVDTYVQRNLDDMSESGTAASDWLHGQLGALKGDLEGSEMQLHDYKKDKNILSLSMDDQSNMLRDEMKQLNDALTEVKKAREAARARRTQLMNITPEDPRDLPATELIQNPLLTQLREAYMSAARDIEGLLAAGRGENHPEVLTAAARRDSTRASLLTEVRNIQGAVTREVAVLDHQAGGIQKLFEAAERRAYDLNVLEIEYHRLGRAKENNEKLYTLVMERAKESDLARTSVFNNIRIVERPILPKRPVSPNVPLNLIGGLIGGLFLGLAAAVGREMFDRTVKTPDDVERVLGTSFLGLLPVGRPESPRQAYGGGRTARRRAARVASSDKSELMVHEHPTSGIAEAARAIRTNILFVSPDTPYRSVLVTSAGPSEGKTTVACWIATAMAQAGRRVLIVDCDMRRPRLHRVFGVPRDDGITSHLFDGMPLDKIIHATAIPNLSVIPTGPLPPNPAEILHSATFHKFLADIKERFDCVVIDSPPVVPVTDGTILSTLVDGTVLVVRAFQTTKALARRAARALRDVGATPVGAVLNAVDFDRHHYGYKYRYYYYYRQDGYAYKADPDPPIAPAA
jgi:succinoglycan biosynthesis transport protein ExoP